MSDQLWVIRAGERARFLADFRDNSHIAVGFTDVAAEDLKALGEVALSARATTPSARNAVGQLKAFVFKMEPGDLVIIPGAPGDEQEFLVGRVQSEYEHVPAGTSDSSPGPHQRRMSWEGTFRRDVLTQGARNTLGAIQTVFRPLNAEAELRSTMTALRSIGDAAPVVRSRAASGGDDQNALPVRAVSRPRALSGAQLDITVDESGRANIRCHYPALVMQQTPRHLDPGAEWSGVPGVYVLTGTELQQSSARTGTERTLTTTLIVRPWAYVGLSEDFIGRLASHRQSKQEWRRALLVRSGGEPFTSDDIKYLERKVHASLQDTGEVALNQAEPRGNLSAQPRNPSMLDACAETVVSVLRLTGTLI